MSPLLSALGVVGLLWAPEGAIQPLPPLSPAAGPVEASAVPIADPALQRAREAFATADAMEVGASSIEAWGVVATEAAAIEDPVVRASMLDAAAHNLVLARLTLFRITGEPQHRSAARRDLEAAIARAEHPSAELLALRDVLDESVAAQAPPQSDRAPVRPSALRLAGIVVTASAALPIAAVAVGLGLGAGAEDEFHAGPSRSERDAADRRGANANALALGGALTAGVLVTVGVSLIAMARERKPGAHARLAPAGLGIRGRF